MRYRAIVEYYDSENEHNPMLREDVPFLLSHLPPRRSILELAAGTGRAALPLAEAGHRVVGIDKDARMLAVARQRRDAARLSPQRLELVRGDVLAMNLERRFDWVVLLFNTFLLCTTLEQQDRLLRGVRRHLKPRGRFWLDIFQPNLSILAQEKSVGLDPMVFHVPALDRTVFKTIDVARDPARQLQRITFNYTWFDIHGVEHRQQQRFNLTFIFPRELQVILERNGFRIERLYGNYDGSRLHADSPRMIACCMLA